MFALGVCQGFIYPVPVFVGVKSPVVVIIERQKIGEIVNADTSPAKNSLGWTKAQEIFGDYVVSFLSPLAPTRWRIVNQGPGLADEVVVILGEGLRLRKSHGVADVAKSVIAVCARS